MRRSFLLALCVALVVLIVAPIAAAQANYQGGRGQGMNGMGMNNGRMEDRGTHANMMASHTSSATASPMSSASASTSASTSASASASATASPSASASPSSAMSSSASAPSGSKKELPDTGGIPLVPLLSAGALIFLASSGVLAARLMRRTS